jgi:hypothetical protein
MKKDKTTRIDTTHLPPGKTVEEYMAQMNTMMLAPTHIINPIYNSLPEPSVAMDNVVYFKGIYKIQLLHQVGAITPKEVARLVSLLDSPDEENWHVAEECIRQKFSEL